MIYNETRFSEIAFTKHVLKAEKCSRCNKPVIQREDHVKPNYHEFVFGADYKELLETFYAGIEYTNFLVYKDGNVKLNSFSLIHNKHDDSFFVPYYNPVKYNEEVIKENNIILAKVFAEYTIQQRKKIINDLWYYYRDRKHYKQELDDNQRNKVDKELKNALTCVDHNSYEINQIEVNLKVEKVKINLTEVDDLFHLDIKKLLKNKSTSRDVFLEYKMRLQAYIYNSYIDWISKTDSFPEMICNSCAGKKQFHKIFKTKHNVDEMGLKPDSRVFRPLKN